MPFSSRRSRTVPRLPQVGHTQTMGGFLRPLGFFVESTIRMILQQISATEKGNPISDLGLLQKS
jgi:hypothetical protein